MGSEKNISEFTEANLKMTRLHELQNAMNQLRINPFSKSHSHSQYNFELWMACIDGLFLEVFTKVKVKRRDECKKKINYAKSEMQKLLLIYDHTLWNLKMHRKTMWKIREALIDAESFVREMLEDTGFGTQQKKEKVGIN